MSASDCWSVGYSGLAGDNMLTLIEQYTVSGWSMSRAPMARTRRSRATSRA
ncbi:MAG: hypothetical protein ABR950_06965 [Candidatus Dormibacteria bacterium]